MAVFLYQWCGLFLFPFLLAKQKETPAALPHPFYISVTEVTHNPAEKSLEISCKFFTDDLEQTLEKNFGGALDITKAQDKSKFDKAIADYVNRRFALAVDGKSVRLSFVGFEVEKEATYCYFEVQQVASVKQMSVANSLLHDFTKEQINIMHTTVGGKRQSTKLDFPETKTVLNF